MTDSLVDLRLRDLFEAIADGSTGVASGAVAAATTASASGLIAMTARRGGRGEDSLGAAGQGEVLRRRATELIDECATAFERAVAVLDGAREAHTTSSEQRDWRLGEALRRAADAPLAVAEVAADTAALATAVATSCDESVRPDAVSACLLAEAAAAIAAHLVAINLAVEADVALRTRAQELSAAASHSREEILGATGG